jgi:hypothetical protein
LTEGRSGRERCEFRALDEFSNEERSDAIVDVAKLCGV